MARSNFSRWMPRSVPRPTPYRNVSLEEVVNETIEAGSVTERGFDSSLMEEDFENAPTVALRGEDLDVFDLREARESQDIYQRRRYDCSEDAPTSRWPLVDESDPYAVGDSTGPKQRAVESAPISTVIVEPAPYEETPLNMELGHVVMNSLAPMAMEALSIVDEPDSLQGHMVEPRDSRGSRPAFRTTFKLNRDFFDRTKGVRGAIVAFASVVGLALAFATVGIASHFQRENPANPPTAFRLADRSAVHRSSASMPDPLGRQFGTVIETPQPTTLPEAEDGSVVAPAAPPQTVVAPPAPKPAPQAQVARPAAPIAKPVAATPAPKPAAPSVKPAAPPPPAPPAPRAAGGSEANLAQKALDDAKRETEGAL